MAASAQLGALLVDPLATDASATDAVGFVLQVLRLSELIAAVEAEGENGAAMLHRWALRITGLLSTSKDSLARSVGLALALETTRQSQVQLLSHGKSWFNSALSMLSRPTEPASTLGAAMTFVESTFARAAHLRLAEFSREVASPAAARTYADCLIAVVARSSEPASRARALEALAALIGLHSSPLRPLASTIQSQSSALLFDAEPAVPHAASVLLSRVYATAGKAQAGASWKRTVEGLCAAIDGLLVSVTTTTILPNALTLAPLELPALQPSSSPSENAANAALRIGVLTDVILKMLCSPTERPVVVPVGVLVRLASRLLTLNSVDGARERHDTSLRLAEMAVVPQLHITACKLVAQLGISIGHDLARHLPALLGPLARTLTVIPASSPVRGSLIAAFSLLIESAPLDPDDQSRSLEIALRCIIQDTSRLVVGQGRKAKRRKVFETDSAFAPAAQLPQGVVVAAQRALMSKSSTPDALNQLMRLMLALTLSPAFAAACSTPGVAASFSPLETAFAEHPTLRVAALDALAQTIPVAGRDAAGLIERAVGVFESASLSVDADVRAAGARGITTLESSLRPRVPPLLRASRKQLMAESYALPERSPSPSPPPSPPAQPPAKRPPEPTLAPVSSTQTYVPPAPVVRAPSPAPAPPTPTLTDVPVVRPATPPPRSPPAPLVSTAPASGGLAESAPKAAPPAPTGSNKPAETAPMAVDGAGDEDEPMPTINLGFTDDEDSEDDATMQHR